MSYPSRMYKYKLKIRHSKWVKNLVSNQKQIRICGKKISHSKFKGVLG